MALGPGPPARGQASKVGTSKPEENATGAMPKPYFEPGNGQGGLCAATQGFRKASAIIGATGWITRPAHTGGQAMNHLLFAAIHVARTQLEAGQTPSEAEMFDASDRALRKGRFLAMIRRLSPGALAARRAARDMQAEAARLEKLSPHLLDDIGVIRQGAEGYIIVTDEDERLALMSAPARSLPAATPDPAADLAPGIVRSEAGTRVAPSGSPPTERNRPSCLTCRPQEA
jgi:uncharacterized protein YjiS (DUF1127 family)